MNTKSFKSFTQVLEYIIKYFKWVVVFASVIIILSGLYRVESNETAVVLRFGRLVGDTYEKQIKKPGLHFALPFFIDEIIKVPVQTMRERDVDTHYLSNEGFVQSDIGGSGYLLTGDNNIVLVRAKVIYQISNPVQYALYSEDTGKVIDLVVSGELTRAVTRMDIDSALTSGRSELSSEIIGSSQIILDRLKTGVAIVGIELTDIVPPPETFFFFEEVRNAAVNKETSINQARENASRTILRAQSESNAYVQAAISNQNVRLTDVHSEMAEFIGLYDQYVINPQIITNGIFRDRAAAIIAQSGGAVILPEGGDPPVILLP